MGYVLRFVGGEQDGTAIPVPPGGAITFGRGRQNDVQVNDRKLSRTHCQVAMRGEKCVVIDLNSTNGTYVSGERIEEHVLSPGDVITIGTTRLKIAFRDDEAPKRSASPVLATCARCGKDITQEELDSGAARSRGEGTYCRACCEALGDDLPAPAPREITVKPGDRFGGYTVGDRLRETLYGVQFKASRKELGNPVFLTLLRTKNADTAAKILQACYRAGTLIHPNILLVYETGEVDGQYFYATEFVDAPTLEEVLAQGTPISQTVAFGIVDQAAHAVAAAAEKHQAHGTLAPCNLYVKDLHACKATDFGFAGIPAFGPGDDPFPMALMPYRAPEQLRGRPIATFEADLFAVGAIFYRLVAGHVPFRGETPSEVRANILEGQFTPIRKAVPDLAENYARIIERCMAPAPAGRYQTPRELLYDFEHAQRA